MKPTCIVFGIRLPSLGMVFRIIYVVMWINTAFSFGGVHILECYCTHAHVHTCVARAGHCAVLYCTLPSWLRKGSHAVLGAHCFASAGWQALGIHLHLPGLGLQTCTAILCFVHGSWDSDSGLHTAEQVCYALNCLSLQPWILYSFITK